MKARLLLVAVGLLVLSNLVTGLKLYSTMKTAKEESAGDAIQAVGQIHEAISDLQPGPVDTEETDWVLRAWHKLQIAYQALYRLETRGDLPPNEPRWSQTVNAISAPLAAMIVSRDYTNLPAVARRLEKLADVVPLDERNSLAKLREAQTRLSDAAKP